MDLLFNPTNLPTGGPNDRLIIRLPRLRRRRPWHSDLERHQHAGCRRQAGTNVYYLGVRNPGTHAVTAVVEVDFDITALSNGVPVSDVLNTTSHSERYFAFDVSSNAFEATFQLLQLSGNADLVVRKGPPLPTLISSDYGSFNTTNADENIYVFTNSQPVPLSAGTLVSWRVQSRPGPVDLHRAGEGTGRDEWRARIRHH